MPDIWVRTECPEVNNPYYNNNQYSRCTTGYSESYPNGYPGLNVLPNCVGSAWGCFNETYIYTTGASAGFHYWVNGDGSQIYDNVTNPSVTKVGDLTEYRLNVESIPPKGGLICWGGGANHVAYISDVTDGNNITTQDSSWGGYSSSTFPDSIWDIRPRRRNEGGTNVWSHITAGVVCQGYIANPAIGGSPLPKITLIQQLRSTQVLVEGNVNNDGSTINLKLYVKWDSTNASIDNYDEIYEQTTASTFNIILNKPRKSTSVAILPVREDNTVNFTIGLLQTAALEANGSCIYLFNNNQIKETIPYIYHNGTWKETIPYIYHNGTWKETL